MSIFLKMFAAASIITGMTIGTGFASDSSDSEGDEPGHVNQQLQIVNPSILDQAVTATNPEDSNQMLRFGLVTSNEGDGVLVTLGPGSTMIINPGPLQQIQQPNNNQGINQNQNNN